MILKDGTFQATLKSPQKVYNLQFQAHLFTYYLLYSYKLACFDSVKTYILIVVQLIDETYIIVEKNP